MVYKLNPASGLFCDAVERKTPITECWRSVKFHSGAGAADEVIFFYKAGAGRTRCLLPADRVLR